jgi:hypothetical protein
MRKNRFGITYCLAALLAVFLVGCGQETVVVPSVISTVPANGATNVLISSSISATFSMAMNPATLTSSTFTVTGPGGTVAGAVTYSGSTATFTPTALLAYSTVYTATITTGAANLGGTPLLTNYVWSFTTITPPPMVVSTVPAAGATSVPIGQALSATFNEAMFASTINATTFTVTGPGGAAVAGTVTYSGLTATFTPTVNLAYSTVYTATIATGAQDLAGQPLASNFVWSFTTITPPPTVTAALPLNGATSVPIGQALSATFNEAMLASTINATTFTVTGPGGAAVAGTVTYSGLTATFTPAATLAYSTVYTAKITTGAQDLAAQPLAANYVWSFTTITPVPTVTAVLPLNSATSVPIGQALSATFSEAMLASTINATTFTVTGPGGTAVAGTITYSGLTATFTPAATLAYSTVYTAKITTGAQDLAAQPLAANYVWSFTTITPPPTVTVTTPLNGALSVPIGQAPSATFNEAMLASTINATTFTVTGPGGAAVAGTVTYSGQTATFTPTVNLAYSTVYTATITTGAQDLAAQPLAANYVWSFTTITPIPTVTVVAPLNNATGVPVAQVLSATFSEAMNPATLNGASFTVTGPGGVVLPGAIAYSGLAATFTPTTNLAYSTAYTATITTGAADLAGQPLAANYVWNFTTISPAPAVIATVPVSAATGVPTAQVLTATFNEAMKCTTLASPATVFTLAGPGATAVPGTVSCAGAVATFTPSANLAVNTLYTATISTGAQDLAGTPMAASYTWSFLTVPAPTPPTVISTAPVNLATGVPVNQAVSATFSLAMNPATVNATTFTLAGPGSTAVTGVVTYVAAGSVATFTPAANLAPSTTYTATITTAALDLAGIGLTQNYVWTFTTAAAPVLVPPTVISTIPLNAATGVPLNQIVSATFSTAMDPATINSTTFQLTGPGTTTVSGLVAYAAVGKTLTFIPAANLAPSTLYTATITSGVQNLAGTAMASNYVWTFTTGAATVITPPQVVSTVPANAATNVALNQNVSATFSKAMNPLTITTATFQLTGPGGSAIAGTVSYDAVNFIATFTPSAPLTASSSYIATVTNGATDVNGNPLGTTGPNPWTFTTGAAAVPPPIVLGPNVSLFGGFGGNAGMTNQGINTVVNASIGTTAASSPMTGFHDTTVVVGGVAECTYSETTLNLGLVNGVIDTAPGTSQPTAACPNEGTAVTFAAATQSAAEALTAYNTLVAIPNGLDVSVCPGCGGGNAGELGNRTLAPGVYKSAVGYFDISAGNLTLDAKGDPNAYWVFQMGTYLTIGTPTSPESVLLVNGAQASHVFWQVGSAATINYGGGGTVVGTIISQAGITISSPGQSTSSTVTTINGRVLALNASVTMVNTVLNLP